MDPGLRWGIVIAGSFVGAAIGIKLAFWLDENWWKIISWIKKGIKRRKDEKRKNWIKKEIKRRKGEKRNRIKREIKRRKD